MDALVLAVAVFLVLNLAAGVAAALRARRASELLVVAMLSGTTTTGVLVLLADGLDLPALRDVALMVAIVAVVPIAAYASTAREGGRAP